MQPETGERITQEAIRIARPTLIAMVAILHGPLAMYGVTGPLVFLPNDYFAVFWTDQIFRSAVPALSIISGYLAVSSLMRYGYAATLRSKVFTILLPMVVWNVVYSFFAMYYNSRGGPAAENFSLLQFNWRLWADAVLGITTLPINQPLYFLRDLFLCFVFAPIFLAARFSVVASTVVLAMIGGAVGLGYLNGYFIRPDILMWFAFGLIFKEAMDWIASRGSTFKKSAVLSYLAVALIAAAIPFTDHHEAYPSARLVVYYAGPFAVWCAFSLMLGTLIEAGLKRVSAFSFTLFLCHGVVIFAFGIVWWKLTETPFHEHLYLYVGLLYATMIAVTFVLKTAYDQWLLTVGKPSRSGLRSV